MRDILFKAKRKDNGEWIEGYYVCLGNYHYILTGKLDITKGYPVFVHYEVLPDTVGQYTGLTDKNGKKMFEGDVLKGSLPDMSCEPKRTGVVQWGMFGWIIKFSVPEWKIPRVGFGSFGEYEVLGNIHDNPEMLQDPRKENERNENL